MLVAFEYFAREKVDLAVVETGLGGRWDATNICEPLACIITSISFDHTEQLGRSLAAIAGEKAGIIKPGVPAVSGVLSKEGDDPQAVVRDAAARNHATLYEIHRDFTIVPNEDGSFDFSQENNGGIAQLRLGLLGQHQRENAALVLNTVMLLRQRGWRISDGAVRTALATLVVPCRVERLRLAAESRPNTPGHANSAMPAIFVDGAHNKASAEALLESLQTFFVAGDGKALTGRKILLFGSTQGKDVPGMLETLLSHPWNVPERTSVDPRCRSQRRLLPFAGQQTSTKHCADDSNGFGKLFFDEIWLSQCTTSPRALPVEELLQLVRDATFLPQNVIVAASPGEAVQRLLQTTGKNDVVIATGSLYFAAQMAAAWRCYTSERQSTAFFPDV